jgi:hypothetical protein
MDRPGRTVVGMAIRRPGLLAGASPRVSPDMEHSRQAAAGDYSAQPFRPGMRRAMNHLMMSPAPCGRLPESDVAIAN